MSIEWWCVARSKKRMSARFFDMVCEEYPRSYVVGKNTSEMERTKMER